LGQEATKLDFENKFEKLNRQIDNLEDRVGEHEIRLASSEAALNNMNYQINQKISISRDI
jgi:predicted RNase H-like nuclease (RuvC/YqgF family)